MMPRRRRWGEMNNKKDLIEEDAEKRRWCDGGRGIEWRKMPRREDGVTEEGG
jgi:hypothetical protein